MFFFNGKQLAGVLPTPVRLEARKPLSQRICTDDSSAAELSANGGDSRATRDQSADAQQSAALLGTVANARIGNHRSRRTVHCYFAACCRFTSLPSPHRANSFCCVFGFRTDLGNTDGKEKRLTTLSQKKMSKN